MELPDDLPRLPKLPFLIGDIAFLSIAAFLAANADSPPSTASIVGIIICAGIGVALGIAPFLADYARKQEQAVIEHQHALTSLARTTASAADQAGIAASGLNEIAESTKQNLRLIDELPAKIQAAKESAESTKANRSASEVASLQKEIKALHQLVKDQTDTLTQALVASQETLQKSIKALPPPRMAPADPTSKAEQSPVDPAKAPPKKKAKRAPKAKKTPPVEHSLFDDDMTPSSVPEPSVEPPPPPLAETESLPPAPHEDKPPATDALTEAPLIPEPVEIIPESPAPEPPEPPTEKDLDTPAPVAESEDNTEDAPDEESGDAPLDSPSPDEPALSADGMTRLTVTAYIGIGNRLFIRGDGPGLSPDEGTPLQFVSIGKWRWETDEATAPIKATLWKNDEEACTSLGEIELKPGAQLETSAHF